MESYIRWQLSVIILFKVNVFSIGFFIYCIKSPSRWLEPSLAWTWAICVSGTPLTQSAEFISFYCNSGQLWDTIKHYDIFVNHGNMFHWTIQRYDCFIRLCAKTIIIACSIYRVICIFILLTFDIKQLAFHNLLAFSFNSLIIDL